MQPERQPSCLPVRPSSNKRSRALAVVLILVLGIGLRLYAAPRLSIGNDERVYLQSSLEYANFIRDGKWGMFIWHDFHPEHPPLHKILYGIALLTQPRLDYLDPQTFIDGMSMYKVEQSRWGLTARLVAVILGSLTVLTLALVDPIAGLFYAVHTVAVQFNSAIFLEALPSLTSLLCALCYLHWYDRVYQKSQPMKETILWLGLSSAFLGMSAASKYTYAVVGLSITIHFTAGILLKKNSIRHLGILAAWGILAIVFFYILDPYI